MQIVYNLPHVFTPDSNPGDVLSRMQKEEDNAYALRALLDCLVNLNLGYLMCHPARPLYQSGVTYGRTLWWEPIPALYQRGYGDCKSLAAALIAQYRRAGVSASPVFRFRPRERRDGNDFHILVQTRSGWEDPSKILGMGADETAWMRG